MELLGADARPHHFVTLRDRSFRPTRPCQALRLAQSSSQVDQSIASLYLICKGSLTACRIVGGIPALRLTSLETDFHHSQ
jgi:hypothetical protein